MKSFLIYRLSVVQIPCGQIEPAGFTPKECRSMIPFMVFWLFHTAGPHVGDLYEYHLKFRTAEIEECKEAVYKLHEVAQPDTRERRKFCLEEPAGPNYIIIHHPDGSHETFVEPKS